MISGIPDRKRTLWSLGLALGAAGAGVGVIALRSHTPPGIAGTVTPGNLSTPGAITSSAASVTIRRNDFTNAPALSASHRGLNFDFLEDAVQWDATIPASNGFASIAANPTFQSLVTALDIGSIRTPGGTPSNYYDYSALSLAKTTPRTSSVKRGKAWISWGINNADQYNKTPGVDWSSFWTFHAATGSVALIHTANVYKAGNKSLTSNWIGSTVAATWVSDFAAKGQVGSNWETGNEVYSSDQVPDLEYPGSATSTGKTYLERACSLATAIKGADSTAKVGLVVYEHEDQYAGFSVLDNASSFCGLASFDFFIIHDYAPLVPKASTVSGSLADGVFYQTGVEMALTYQNLVSNVSDLRTYLASAHPSDAQKPVYVTEWSLIMDNAVVDVTKSNWINKGVSFLMLHHFLNLVAQGAGGLWYWEPLGSYNRLIDPDAVLAGTGTTTTKAYELLQQAFKQRGGVVELDVTGSRTYIANGPIGSGCLEGDAPTKCWYAALGYQSVAEQPYLKAFAAYASGGKLYVTVFNFGATSQTLSLKLSGFTTAKSTVKFDRWSLQATSSWDDVLGAATTSTSSAASSFGTVSISSETIPARSVVIYTIAL